MPAHHRVLIVEDEVDIRAALAEALAFDGHHVIEASNGAEGLRLARDGRPDLIVLDLMMPVMDGWAFRKAQLADATLATIPVVVVSAFLEDQVHALGVVAHLHKPFNLNDLLDAVHTCCAPAA